MEHLTSNETLNPNPLRKAQELLTMGPLAEPVTSTLSLVTGEATIQEIPHVIAVMSSQMATLGRSPAIYEPVETVGTIALTNTFMTTVIISSITIMSIVVLLRSI